MKKFLTAFLVMVATFTAAQSTSPAPGSDSSLAPQSIAEAHRAIAEKPKQYVGYNLLAMALVRRAQETSDATYYTQAAEALKKSLELSPNNFETQKIQVAILLAEDEHPAALEAAKALNKRVPDDVAVYGLLTDANLGVGNYEAAENATQWMLNLRPGNLPALTRAAQLRELFGDIDGAYELMDLAYQSTSPAEATERASILTQMGHLRLAAGDTAAAQKQLQQALATFPGFPSALGTLAQLRMAQKRYAEAVTLLQQRYQGSTRVADLYELAKALQLAGNGSEAKKAFAEFEAKALLDSSRKDNSNLQLIFYCADYAQQPSRALKLAQQEIAWRHDVHTLDAYAWALHVNGQDVEARKQIETALAVGIRDAEFFRHAGEIALKTGDVPAANRYLKESAELSALGSGQAKKILSSLSQAEER